MFDSDKTFGNVTFYLEASKAAAYIQRIEAPSAARCVLLSATNDLLAWLKQDYPDANVYLVCGGQSHGYSMGDDYDYTEVGVLPPDILIPFFARHERYQIVRDIGRNPNSGSILYLYPCVNVDRAIALLGRPTHTSYWWNSAVGFEECDFEDEYYEEDTDEYHSKSVTTLVANNAVREIVLAGPYAHTFLKRL